MQHPHEAGPVFFGEIRPGKEGLLVGGHKNAGGPAASAGKNLADGEIDAVDVRAFLPVHFNGDEMFVEQRGDAGILKAFVGHHMAPVAGAVADAEKDRFILPAGLFKGVFPPGVPVHRVFRVLKQIGAGLAL